MYKIIGADGKEYGPISADQLRQWIAEGRAIATTHVLPAGAAAWVPLGSLPEFAPAVRPALPMYLSTAPPRNHPLAVTGLILGILSLTMGWCCCSFYGIPFNVPGIIVSLIALNDIRKSPNVYQGRSLAITGLVLCVLSIVLMIVVIGLVGLSSSTDWEKLPHGRRL